MSLEGLAPDQRAVVQLVLQQERSYDELAGLLGISAEAVRERAHRGLERISAGEDVDSADRAQVSDYLLGQQSVSGREATRSLLSYSPEASRWALAVAAQLEGVARGPLPEIPAAPSGRGAVDAGEPEEDDDDLSGPFVPDEDEDDLSGPFVPDGPDERAADPVRASLDEPFAESAATTAAEPEEAGVGAGGDGPPVRARPRPRPAPGGLGPPAERRSSKLGGALLIGGLALILAVLAIWIVSKNGDDDGKEAASSTPTATATASATPGFQAVGQIELAGQDGARDAKGTMTLFAAPSGAVAFTIQGTGMPENQEGEAYAVWLLNDKPHRLGFAPSVGKDGKFGTSGPRESDAAKFTKWLSDAKQIVVTRETTQDAGQPGEVVLSGRLQGGQ